MGWMKDERGLGKTPANYVPLTPLSHLARAAKVFPTREAVIDGPHRATYAERIRLLQALKGIDQRWETQLEAE